MVEQNQSNGYELLHFIRSSPQEGLKLAIDRYGGMVKAICGNLLSGCSREDVEEAVADSFIAFWKAVDKNVHIKISVKSYLAGIAHYCTINKLCSVTKNRFEQFTEEFDIGVELDMSSEIVRKTNINILREIIDAMPDIEKEIFVRRYFLYEKVKDIAEKMDLNPKKVENILCRYKAKLREQLEERGITA